VKVTVWVLDPDGLGIGNAYVEVYQWMAGIAVGYWQKLGAEYTTPDGDAEFDLAPFVSYWFNVSAPGYEPNSEQLTIFNPFQDYVVEIPLLPKPESAGLPPPPPTAKPKYPVYP